MILKDYLKYSHHFKRFLHTLTLKIDKLIIF